MQASRFNFAIGNGAQIALFNAFTGALMCLDGPDAIALGQALENPRMRFSPDDVGEALFEELTAEGFLVPPQTDELATNKARYLRARKSAPVVLTVTLTMDCNLGCYYCYEARSKEALSADDDASVAALAVRLVENSSSSALHIDWYGGEPVMQRARIEALSQKIINVCRDRGWRHDVSIISNGSFWPEDALSFARRNHIRQVQISFDGLKRNHDKRRRPRASWRREGASSYEEARPVVDALCGHIRVDVRFNIDRGKQADLTPFIEMAKARGWFEGEVPARLQPARLSAYSKRSSFMRDAALSLDEFDRLRADARAAMGEAPPPEESETPDGFPFPKTSVCAALAENSVVTGAEGKHYRCGLQVGEQGRAVGSSKQTAQADEREQREWWDRFDPTENETCSVCSFLPICWGGCPKKHLERDFHAIGEQGRYWRRNLGRMVAAAARIELEDGYEVCKTRQFR